MYCEFWGIFFRDGKIGQIGQRGTEINFLSTKRRICRVWERELYQNLLKNIVLWKNTIFVTKKKKFAEQIFAIQLILSWNLILQFRANIAKNKFCRNIIPQKYTLLRNYLAYYRYLFNGNAFRATAYLLLVVNSSAIIQITEIGEISNFFFL